MMISALDNKRVLIVGAGITGLSVARYLTRHGVSFEMADGACTDDYECPESLSDIQLHPTFSDALFSSFDVIILSPGVPRELGPVQSALAKGVDVIGDIELFADAANAPVIAVTGSNGKSTVVSWIAEVLNAIDMRAVLCGNIGQPALDSLCDDADCYVLELSSYQLESTRSLKPLAATVLNVSDDHLDRYASIEHYAAVKRSVLKQAKNIIVNEDDPATWPDASNDSDHKADTVSSISLAGDSSNTNHQVRWHRSNDGEATWLCRNGKPLVDQSRLSVPGEHNALNALAVLALIEPLGVGVELVVDSLIAFTGLPHRTEFLGMRDGVRWYNDSKGTNIDACIKAIEAMPGPVILIAGGLGKDANFGELGPAVKACVNTAVLIGRDAELISQALAPYTSCLAADSLEAAVKLAADLATDGDVVLLSPACASFDMFKSYEHRGDCFRELVQEVQVA